MTAAALFDALPWAAALTLISGAWAGLWWLRRDTLRAGRLEAENNQMGEVLDDVETARHERYRLGADPDHARRVREQFTRD